MFGRALQHCAPGLGLAENTHCARWRTVPRQRVQANTGASAIYHFQRGMRCGHVRAVNQVSRVCGSHPYRNSGRLLLTYCDTVPNAPSGRNRAFTSKCSAFVSSGDYLAACPSAQAVWRSVVARGRDDQKQIQSLNRGGAQTTCAMLEWFRKTRSALYIQSIGTVGRAQLAPAPQARYLYTTRHHVSCVLCCGRESRLSGFDQDTLSATGALKRNLAYQGSQLTRI